MHTRKARMAELSDGFIALPGGLGTFEELFEVWTWRQLGYHSRPLALLNTAGYYDGLLQFLLNTVEQGFVAPQQYELLIVDSEPDRLLGRVAHAMGGMGDAIDLSRT